MVDTLRWIGGITIGLGVIAGVVLLVEFGQEGMFSDAGLTPGEIGIVAGVIFYGLVHRLGHFSSQTLWGSL